MDLNGLMLMTYRSMYGAAYEVLTVDGAQRISSGDNKEAVLEEALKFLEARAMLTGTPMRRHIDVTAFEFERKHRDAAHYLELMREALNRDV